MILNKTIQHFIGFFLESVGGGHVGQLAYQPVKGEFRFGKSDVFLNQRVSIVLESERASSTRPLKISRTDWEIGFPARFSGELSQKKRQRISTCEFLNELYQVAIGVEFGQLSSEVRCLNCVTPCASALAERKVCRTS